MGVRHNAGIAWMCLVLAASCTPPPQSTQVVGTEEADRAAITTASRAFSTAYVEGDTATLADLYTDDALVLPPGRTVQGREAIQRYFGPGANRVNVSHSMTSERLELNGDLATDVGMWSNTYQIGDGGAQTGTGRYLVVWRRGPDGRWRMEYDMWHRPVS